ncbi:MAG: hypothetical protein OEZ39_09695 [Gammaproteobacteria bacterium]|nr:hypothetical protein [Gammaproteobacteria bacterium]
MEPADKKEINRILLNYGQKWAGGIAHMEQDYTITLTKTADSYVLDATLKLPPAISVTQTLARSGDGFRAEPYRLPELRELNHEELATIDDILKKTRQLILLTSSNGYLKVVDTSQGYKEIAKQQINESEQETVADEITIATRKNGEFAILYYRKKWDPWFCLWFDLDKKQIGGANWIDIPMNNGGYLAPADVEFIDHALKKHGDFGVYGNVTGGLLEQAKYFQVQINHDPKNKLWLIDINPHDGHGHFLQFYIDKTTGKIGGMSAGHIEPMPEPTPDPQ